MRDEHLDTISESESDEFIKSNVENLIPNPSESEDLSDSECDVPACDDFTTFSNLLFDADDDFSSSDNESASLNVESDLIKSLLNHDSSITSSSLKIDSLLDEFASELILLKSIPTGIDVTDCDPKEEIRLIEKLFDPLMEEIDLSFTLDDPMSSGIEEDDYDSERDMLIFEELISNDSFLLPENESFHFDIPSFSRPLAKPPDDNSRILTVKVVDDIFELYVPRPKLLPTKPTLVSNQKK
nr:hypothetical protein [Tanacetum cinerariifolium]